MDQIRPWLTRGLAAWRSLGRAQQIGLVGLLAAAVALASVLATVGHGPDMAVAFNNLSDEDAAAIVTRLKEAKIPYEIGERGSIRVPGGMVNEVKVMMAGQGLGGKPSAGTGFELFNQPQFGQTDFTQRINYQRALEGELARSIGRLDAVDSARVHLAIPQPTLFASQQKETTASVILKLKPGKQLDRSQVQAIGTMVSGSVEGLKPQNLAIVDVNGNLLSDQENASSPAGLSTSQLEAQRSYETTVTRDLQAVLDRVLGSGMAVVRVNAALDWDQLEETRTTYSPRDGVEPQKKTESTTREVQAPGAANPANAGGVPGPTANGAAPTYQGGQVPNGQGGYEKTQTQTTWDVSQSVQKLVRSPGAIKRLNVSVMVDQATVSQEQADAIREAVATAAGLDRQTRGDQITVAALPFNREELRQVNAAMADAQQRDQIFEYGRLAVLALGPILMALVLFFVLGRRPRAAVATPGAASPAIPSDFLKVLAASAATHQSAAAAATPPAPIVIEDPEKRRIRNQIAQLARTDPATMAQLLQTWIDEDRRN